MNTCKRFEKVPFIYECCLKTFTNVFDADIFLFKFKGSVRIRAPAVVYGTFSKRFSFVSSWIYTLVNGHHVRIPDLLPNTYRVNAHTRLQPFTCVHMCTYCVYVRLSGGGSYRESPLTPGVIINDGVDHPHFPRGANVFGAKK
jgi:hypothetical protein